MTGCASRCCILFCAYDIAVAVPVNEEGEGPWSKPYTGVGHHLTCENHVAREKNIPHRDRWSSTSYVQIVCFYGQEPDPRRRKPAESFSSFCRSSTLWDKKMQVLISQDTCDFATSFQVLVVYTGEHFEYIM